MKNEIDMQEKPFKFQLGGAMTNPVPIDIQTVDRSGMLQPTVSAGSGASRQSAVKPATDALSKVDALASDREALYRDIASVKEQLAAKATDPDFINTDEYKNLASKLKYLSTTATANLKANKQKYNQVYQDTKKNGTEWAVSGNKVFVQDTETGAYDIVTKQDAFAQKNSRNKPRYIPQTVATALNVRADDPKFSLNGKGGVLEDMIRGSYSSDAINKSVMDAFKGTGYEKGSVATIATNDGEVSVADLVKLADSSKKKGVVTRKTQGNEKALLAARDLFMSTIDSGKMSAMQDKLWQKYYMKYAGAKDAPDADEWMSKQLNNQLNSAMSKYLKTNYAEEIKSSSKSATGEEAEDLSKKTIRMNPVIDAFTTPTATLQAENKAIANTIDGMDNVYNGMLNMPAANIDGIEEQYNKQFPEDVPKTIDNNYFVNKLVGDTDKFMLADGTPVSEVGGADTMVKSKNSGITFVQKVPIATDPTTGRESIAWDAMKLYTEGDQKVKEEQERIYNEAIAAGYTPEEATSHISSKIPQIVAKYIPQDHNIKLKTMAVMKVIVSDSAVPDGKEGMFGSNVSNKDKEFHNDQVDEWFVTPVETLIFAPIEQASVYNGDFGLKEETLKMDVYKKRAQSAQHNANKKWDEDEFLSNLQTLVTQTEE